MKSLTLTNQDTIPMFGLGTWKSPPGEVYQAVKTALAIGYKHIDCAPIYRNEPEVGQAIQESLNSGIVKREEIWITSKLWNSDHQSSEVIPALKQTLKDLQLEYLDLFLIHWPIALKKGVLFPEKASDYLTLTEVPLIETWSAMIAASEQGLCKHIGVSNFSQQKLADLIAQTSYKPEVNQVESHPYLQQNELLAYCQSQGIVFTAYSPLGSSDRPQVFKKADEPSLLTHPVILDIAVKHNLTPAQVLIAWGINRDTVVIPKSVNPERIAENLAASEVNLTSEDMQAIANLELNYRYVDGSFWEIPGSPYTVAELWN